MAQPRLNFTMAMDGVLPPFFAEVDEKQNLKKGTKVAGAVMIIIATVVPFAHLDDLISSGILIAFTITDASIILVRHTSPHDEPFKLERLLIVFHVLSLVSGLLFKNCISEEETGHAVRVMTLTSCAGSLIIGNLIRTKCPRVDEADPGFFLTPAVPILPLCGCFVSKYLVNVLQIYNWLVVL
jgi:amino acid transporter